MHIIFLHCWHTGVIAALPALCLSPPLSPLSAQPANRTVSVSSSSFTSGRKGERKTKDSSRQNKCCNHSSYFTAWALFYFPSPLHLDWSVLGEGGGGHCYIYCLGAEQLLGIFGLFECYFFNPTSDCSTCFTLLRITVYRLINLMHKSH